jgi:hypothetical protein
MREKSCCARRQHAMPPRGITANRSGISSST